MSVPSFDRARLCAFVFRPRFGGSLRAVPTVRACFLGCEFFLLVQPLDVWSTGSGFISSTMCLLGICFLCWRVDFELARCVCVCVLCCCCSSDRSFTWCGVLPLSLRRNSPLRHDSFLPLRRFVLFLFYVCFRPPSHPHHFFWIVCSV